MDPYHVCKGKSSGANTVQPFFPGEMERKQTEVLVRVKGGNLHFQAPVFLMINLEVLYLAQAETIDLSQGNASNQYHLYKGKSSGANTVKPFFQMEMERK